MEPDFHAFTLNASGLLRSIVTEARIFSPFDPFVSSQPPPTLRSYNALWDTGATVSAISAKVVEECALKSVGVTQVSTAGGATLCEIYLIGIFLPNNVGFQRIFVTKASLGKIDVLIGMDLISKGDFALTHQLGKTVFSFRYPSVCTIDFREPPIQKAI